MNENLGQRLWLRLVSGLISFQYINFNTILIKCICFKSFYFKWSNNYWLLDTIDVQEKALFFIKSSRTALAVVVSDKFWCLVQRLRRIFGSILCWVDNKFKTILPENCLALCCKQLRSAQGCQSAFSLQKQQNTLRITKYISTWSEVNRILFPCFKLYSKPFKLFYHQF